MRLINLQIIEQKIKNQVTNHNHRNEDSQMIKQKLKIGYRLSQIQHVPLNQQTQRLQRKNQICKRKEENVLLLLGDGRGSRANSGDMRWLRSRGRWWVSHVPSGRHLHRRRQNPMTARFTYFSLSKRSPSVFPSFGLAMTWYSTGFNIIVGG